jgi:hypothetical protein
VRRQVDDLLRSRFETGKDAAPKTLFSYANYPSTQYLDQLLRLLQRLPRERIRLPALSGAASGLDQRPAPSLDRAGFGFGRRGAPATGKPAPSIGKFGSDGTGACGHLCLLMDRLVDGGTQGRGMVFRCNPREPGSPTGPATRRRRFPVGSRGVCSLGIVSGFLGLATWASDRLKGS